MAMTSLEKKLMKMSPKERKQAVAEISNQMGLPPSVQAAVERKRSAKKK